MADQLLCPNPQENANDPNTEYGRRLVQAARDAVLEGLRKGVPRIVNLQKVYSMVQGAEESPPDFLTRLKDIYRRHTDVNPEHIGNIAALRTAFISQSALDIRRKFQKLPNPSALSIEALLRIAFQVYYHRSEAEEQKKWLGVGGWVVRHSGPLYWDRCANCGRQAHWYRDCRFCHKGNGSPGATHPTPHLSLFPLPGEHSILRNTFCPLLSGRAPRICTQITPFLSRKGTGTHVLSNLPFTKSHGLACLWCKSGFFVNNVLIIFS